MENANNTNATVPFDPLQAAADHRAHGNCWEYAARRAKMSVEELQAKTREQPEYWKKQLRNAEKDVIRETGCETIAILRNLLRSEDPKIQLSAANIYMKFWNTNTRHKPKALRKSDHPMDMVDDEALFTDEMCYESSREVVERVEAKMTPEEKKKWDESFQWKKDHPFDADAWKKDIPGHPEYRDPKIYGQFCHTNEGKYYRKIGPDGKETRLYVNDKSDPVDPANFVNAEDGPPETDPPPPREEYPDAPSHAQDREEAEDSNTNSDG